MSNKMTDEQIDKIARAIAAKIGEPGGPGPLGCGDASSTQGYTCNSSGYDCNTSYECGGAGAFRCYAYFRCYTNFQCDAPFSCASYFSCPSRYNT